MHQVFVFRGWVLNPSQHISPAEDVSCTSSLLSFLLVTFSPLRSSRAHEKSLSSPSEEIVSHQPPPYSPYNWPALPSVLSSDSSCSSVPYPAKAETECGAQDGAYGLSPLERSKKWVQTCIGNSLGCYTALPSFRVLLKTLSQSQGGHRTEYLAWHQVYIC